MLTVRAQTLALHEGSVGGEQSDRWALECRVQLMCQGRPLRDAANAAALRDGSPWAPVAQKERTVKFKYAETLSGQFAFDGSEGAIECHVLARLQGAPDSEARLIGIASLDPHAALRERSPNWPDLHVFAAPSGGGAIPAGAKKLGVLVVKVARPSARSSGTSSSSSSSSAAAAAAAAMPALPAAATDGGGARATLLTGAAAAATATAAGDGGGAGPAKPVAPSATPVAEAAAVLPPQRQPAQPRPPPSTTPTPSQPPRDGAVEHAMAEELRRQLAAEEEEVRRAAAECDAAEAALAAAAAQTAALRDELGVALRCARRLREEIKARSDSSAGSRSTRAPARPRPPVRRRPRRRGRGAPLRACRGAARSPPRGERGIKC